MIVHKKGLSTVVTTLIIILLVLVAIGIIWVVIRGVIDTGSSQIDAGVACPLVSLQIVGNKTCDVDSCTVTVKRNAGGQDFEGVVVVISNSSMSASNDYNENIGQLTTTDINASVSVINPTKVIVAPFFRDSQNNKQVCPNPIEYNLA